MKKFKFTISGKQYEVEVQSFENDKAQVVVNGTQYEVDVEREKEEATPAAAPAGDANGVKAVAPLPGTIMQIFVNVGDQVKRGDKILMYEAMKMENNFLAEADGVIKDIKVKVGDNVLQGAVLAIIG